MVGRMPAPIQSSRRLQLRVMSGADVSMAGVRMMAMILCWILLSRPCNASGRRILSAPLFPDHPHHSMPVRLRIRGGGVFESPDSSYNATFPRRIQPATESSTEHPYHQYQRQGIPLPPWRGFLGGPNGAREVSKYRRHHPCEYRDVVQCNVWQGSWTNQADDESDDPPDVPNERSSNEGDKSYVDYRGRLEGSRKLSHSPVVYQYYGRSRIRGNPSDSVHFVLLGPNVDHWKAVGQVLAARGFNTIACERLKSGPNDGKDTSEDAPNLVLDVLLALKWKKVIVVGCDSEAILAMETAMMLCPDQVVGLVLAGDLASANQVAAAAGVGELENFLRRVLDCPFLIVSDSDTPTVVSGSSAHKALETDSTDKCLILGGGTAPHRLKPEQFAWVLTRFVEEKLEIVLRRKTLAPKERAANGSTTGRINILGDGFLRALNLPFGVNTLVSPEGRLLLGRAVAAALFYITAMRVIVIQYGILRAGLIAIKSRYESIDALTKKGIQAVGSFIVNFGYIPRLFTLKRATDDEEEENRRSGTIVLPNEQDAQGEPGRDEKKGEDVSNDPGGDDGNKQKQENNEPEDNNARPEEEPERPPFFKPFFFLDNVVT